jgi:ornithine--oxo-acid transaminase
MNDEFWRAGFGPLLQDTQTVPFADISALNKILVNNRFAAFVVEPLQAEAGVRVPPKDYLQQAQKICRETGTLFVLDEVQTGMFRTGTFLAAHQFEVQPDMVILAKALSGGLMPVSAVLMTDRIYHSVYSSLKRSIVHTSTFSENSLSMRAGLATLDVLEKDNLGAQALQLGEEFRTQLRHALAPFQMVREVRGMGMLSGIQFAPPKKFAIRVFYEAFNKIHPAMFGQIIVMRLFREFNILTQICGNNFMVLKAAPPLTTKRQYLDEFISAICGVVDMAETSPAFWTEALAMARRAAKI